MNVPIDAQQAQIAPAPGTQVAPPTSQTPQTVNVSSKSSPWGVMVGVLLVVVVIILIIVVVNSDDSSDDTPTPVGDGTPGIDQFDDGSGGSEDAPASE